MSFRAPTIPCGLCCRSFPFGHGHYDGRHIRSWGFSLCERCRSENREGIDPDDHRQFVERLRDRGVDVTLNEEGLLPIPPMGH
jgi:hypothetical protein